jgi:exodeoxyribonuclease VII large subunit
MIDVDHHDREPQSTALWSPSDALGAVDAAVRVAWPHPIWLAGEIVQVNASGRHIYMTLSDERTEVRVAAIGLDAQRVRGRLARAGLVLDRGASVRVYGHLQTYPTRGLVELRAIDIDTVVAVGEAELERRRVVLTIAGLGLADAQHAMPTPVAPLRVGVVTPLGQGWEDFEARLAMTPWAWDIRVLITPSEGAAAPEVVARAIRAHSPEVDLLVITRGGGPAATAAYDAAVVATAVCQAACPVIVAVGHNADSPVAEKVAWRHEATPTAAAVTLDRILAAQRDALAANLAAAVTGAEQFLAEQTRQLEETWNECRVDLERLAARQPTSPWSAPTNSLTNPVGIRWQVAAAAAVAVLVVVLIIWAVIRSGMLR